MPRLNALLTEWKGPTDLPIAGGGLLIRHWPAEGSAAYLHELYRPCTSAERELIEDRFGFDLPHAYALFLSENNGARLFRGIVSLQGYVTSIVRSVDPRLAQPVSLIDYLDEYESLSRQRYLAGWRRIGRVTVNSQWNIEMCKQGVIEITNDDHAKTYADIWAFLEAMAELLTPFFCAADQRIDWNEIDTQLSQAFSAQH